MHSDRAFRFLSLFRTYNPLFDEPRRIPPDHRPRLHILKYSSPCAHHSSLAHGHARPDEGLGGHPGTVGYDNRPFYLLVTRRGNIVRSRAQETTLRYRGVHPKFDGCRVVAIHSGSQTRMVFHHQVPRHENTDRSIDIGRISYLSPKQTQQTAFPRHECALWERTCQQRPANAPQHPLHTVGRRVG